MKKPIKRYYKKIIQPNKSLLCNKYIREKVARAEEDYKNGRYVTSNQLREESKLW